jgi:hypothetical protein
MPHSLGQHVMTGNCFRTTAPQHRWGPVTPYAASFTARMNYKFGGPVVARY